MEELINYYNKLLSLLDKESEQISQCFQGELLVLYREILTKEKERIQSKLHQT